MLLPRGCRPESGRRERGSLGVACSSTFPIADSHHLVTPRGRESRAGKSISASARSRDKRTEVSESPTPTSYGEVVSVPLPVARNMPNAASNIVRPSFNTSTIIIYLSRGLAMEGGGASSIATAARHHHTRTERAAPTTVDFYASARSARSARSDDRPDRTIGRNPSDARPIAIGRGQWDLANAVNLANPVNDPPQYSVLSRSAAGHWWSSGSSSTWASSPTPAFQTRTPVLKRESKMGLS